MSGRRGPRSQREKPGAGETTGRKPVHRDNSLGPTDPGARIPAQEF